MKEKASLFFKSRRGNCAQAVANAWSEDASKTPQLLEKMSAYGGGRAPKGHCGALYAAEYLVEEKNLENLVKDFKEISGGHVACRQIRQSKSLSCLECVETAAELLEKYI